VFHPLSTMFHAVLVGAYIEAEHCIIRHENGTVQLVPREGARCSINSVRVHQPTRLNQGKERICLESRYSSLHVVQWTLPFPLARTALIKAATQTFNMCTRYPLLLGGLRQCRFIILPKDFIHDQCAGNRTPDLSLSGPTPYH
jgi:hypothetical protein